MYLGAIPASISFKILNISILNNFTDNSYHQINNTYCLLSVVYNFCHVLSTQ